MEVIECSAAQFDDLVAEAIITRVADWQAENTVDLFRLGLSGGSTPMAVYGLIAEDDRIDWDRVLCIITDERFVPPADEDSNLGMISDYLLGEADVPMENVVFFDTESTADWEESANMMNDQLLDLQDEREPLFDLLLLGVGTDGHVASVFPDLEVCEEDSLLAITVEAPAGFAVKKRLSLTLPALGSAAEVFFLLKGDMKEEIFEVMQDDGNLPVHSVINAVGDVSIYYGV